VCTPELAKRSCSIRCRHEWRFEQRAKLNPGCTARPHTDRCIMPTSDPASQALCSLRGAACIGFYALRLLYRSDSILKSFLPIVYGTKNASMFCSGHGCTIVPHASVLGLDAYRSEL